MTRLLTKPTVILKRITPDAQDLIEEAGRLCWDSEGKDAAKFIQSIVKRGHESVVEHGSASFLIEASRAALAQITRHRICSYSVRSQRYVDESDFDYMVPPSIMSNPAAYYDFELHMKLCQATYMRLRDQGIKKEDARFVIPNACLTKFMMTANLREWRHFIKIRSDKAAQWEVRSIAKDILADLYAHTPAVFFDLLMETTQQ